MSNALLVLYQVSNHECDKGNFNAFQMPRNGAGVSLAAVKRHCKALQILSHTGTEGFHWRVRMDDKAANSREPSYSWWDIQDENARLPTKDNLTLSQVQDLFQSSSRSNTSSISSTGIQAANKASGAIRSLGKAMNAAVIGSSESHQRRDDRDDPTAPRVNVITFKLLDLTKVKDKFAPRTASPATPKVRRKPPRSTPAPTSAHRATQARPQTRPQPRVQHQQPSSTASVPRVQTQQQPQVRRQAPRQEASLMDFAPTVPSHPTTTTHTTRPTQTPQTRAQKLKQEYDKKKRTQNKVWDDVDQRWVEVDPNKQSSSSTSKTSSEPPPPPSQEKKIVGISISASNAIGKSANVQAAVQTRVREMEESQQKAIQELKEREAKVKSDADEEDAVRKRLEPKLRAWSEEHGKKKQLRALLSSLHMILWEGSGWKQVSLGDILEEKKARRCYLKATLKVHPDKTRDLDAEKRFIAKRVFDALSQAMTQFENSN